MISSAKGGFTGDCCGLDVVALRGNREPSLRYPLAIAHRYRTIVGYGTGTCVLGSPSQR